MRSVLFGIIIAAAAFLLACSNTAPLANVKKMATDADVPRISVADAKQEVDSGNAVIVDSRPDTAFTQERIAGAVNIPFGTNNDAFSKLPAGKKIIVYCS